MTLVRSSAGMMLAAFAFALAPAAAVAAPDPVDINVIIPLTGFAAFIGKSYLGAFKAIEADVNAHGGIKGRPVKFVVSDDGGNPQTAAQLFDGLAAKGTAVVLGATLSAECAALVPRLHDGPLLYCLTPSVNPVPGGYMFSAEPSTIDQIITMVHYFKNRGMTRIAVITTTDASGQDADKGIATAMAAPGNRGVTEVAHEHFAPTDLSVSAQLERIRAANPQVLLAWTTGSPLGTVLRGLADAAYAVPVCTNNGNMTYAQMTAYKSFLPETLYFPAVAAVVPDAVTDRAVKSAVEHYQKDLTDVGVTPEFIPSVAYDPSMFVIGALRALGPDATATQLRDYLNAIKDVPGTNGRYNFATTPNRGLAPSTIFASRWDPAKNTWVAVSKSGGEL